MSIIKRININRHGKTLRICGIIILSFSQLIYARGTSGEFKTVYVSVSYAINSNHNMFHNYWHPANGIEFQAETPFYYGIAELGIQFSRISSRHSTIPDYDAAFIFLGWGLEQRILSNLHSYIGMRAGNYYMDFEDDDIYPTLKSESELGLGLQSRLRLELGHNFSAVLAGRYRVIYTHQRIYHSFISFGISKSFETPKWLKDFLK